jgi:hypothetical protein
MKTLLAGLDLSKADHLIKKCKYCGAEIVWLRNRKGKYYPVNFRGLIDVNKTDFHNCEREKGS